MNTRHFLAKSGKIYGFDSPDQDDFIGAVIAAEWEEVTGNWPPPPPVQPDIIGFISSIKNTLGNAAGIIQLPSEAQSAISLSLTALTISDWPDLEIYITSIEKHIDADKYAAIKEAVTIFNIPITLA